MARRFSSRSWELLHVSVHRCQGCQLLGAVVEPSDKLNQPDSLLRAQVVKRFQAQGVQLDLVTACAFADRMLHQPIMTSSPFELTFF